MRDFYPKKTVKIPRKVFERLMKAIAKKLQDEWEDKHGEIPNYKIKSERSGFFGTGKYRQENIPSLFYYMSKNGDVQDCLKKTGKSFKPEYLRNRYVDFEGDKNFEYITFKTNPQCYIYFLYVGENSLENFQKSKWCRDLNLEEEQNNLEGSKIISRKNIEWTKYFLYGLRITESRIVKHEININLAAADKHQMQVKMISEKGNPFYGIGKYEYPYLEIRMDRKDSENAMWMPFTLYFRVDASLHTTSIMKGTHNGVAFHSKQAIAGTSILIKEDADDFKKKEEKAKQYLFVETQGTEEHVDSRNLASHINNTRLLYGKSDTDAMLVFEGTHELYDFNLSDERFLTVNELNISENLGATIESPFLEYEYIAQISKHNTSLLMDIKAKKRTGENEHYKKAFLAVIDTENTLAKVNGVKLLKGYCCGVNRGNKMESFPFILALNPENPQKRAYSLEEIKNDSDEKKKEMNHEIIRLLYLLEHERKNKIEKLTESISGIKENLNP